MNRAEKQVEIETLTGAIENARIAMLADYQGLTVAEITELRAALRDAGSVGKVVKNTLGKLSATQALKDSPEDEREKFLALFQGPNLLVTTEEDSVGLAKVVTKFAKEHEKLEIKGAWFDGECIDESGVKDLSNMPSREELIAKLLSLLTAPATQLVRLLQAPASQTVQVLEAHRANMEKEGKE